MLTEGAKISKFNHPNIVKLIDVIEFNQTAYLAMEEINGPTLLSAVESKSLHFDKAVVDLFATQMIDALVLVHSAGLVHCDVAPDNVLIDMRDSVPRFVLIDFGGARRLVGDESVSSSRWVTKTGFSAPEQYSFESSGRLSKSPATDVYGLAATLYWLICGKKPIDAPSRIITDTLARLGSDSELVAIYGQNFLAAVDFGLELRPAMRPASAEDFRQILQEPEAITKHFQIGDILNEFGVLLYEHMALLASVTAAVAAVYAILEFSLGWDAVNVANLVVSVFVYCHAVELLLADRLAVEKKSPRYMTMFVAQAIFSVGVVLGLLMLVIPGLVLWAGWAALLGFIVVDRTSGIEALGASWRATSGSRLAIVAFISLGIMSLIGLALIFLPS